MTAASPAVAHSHRAGDRRSWWSFATCERGLVDVIVVPDQRTKPGCGRAFSRRILGFPLKITGQIPSTRWNGPPLLHWSGTIREWPLAKEIGFAARGSGTSGSDVRTSQRFRQPHWARGRVHGRGSLAHAPPGFVWSLLVHEANDWPHWPQIEAAA